MSNTLKETTLALVDGGYRILRQLNFGDRGMQIIFIGKNRVFMLEETITSPSLWRIARLRLPDDGSDTRPIIDGWRWRRANMSDLQGLLNTWDVP